METYRCNLGHWPPVRFGVVSARKDGPPQTWIVKPVQSAGGLSVRDIPYGPVTGDWVRSVVLLASAFPTVAPLQSVRLERISVVDEETSHVHVVCVPVREHAIRDLLLAIPTGYRIVETWAPEDYETDGARDISPFSTAEIPGGSVVVRPGHAVRIAAPGQTHECACWAWWDGLVAHIQKPATFRAWVAIRRAHTAADEDEARENAAAAAAYEASRVREAGEDDPFGA